MKTYRTFTEQEMINKTQSIIHAFYNRTLDQLYAVLSDSFMWIGAFENQWSQSRDQFIELCIPENKEKRVILSQEEYHVLTHEKNLWVIYGRYTTSVLAENEIHLYMKVRTTFIWKQFENTMFLLHIHNSNAHDIPFRSEKDVKTIPLKTDSENFHYIENVTSPLLDVKKLQLRDRNNFYHFLYPEEILYFTARRQYCIVSTQSGDFEVRGGISKFEQEMPDIFLRIHKSYLVNRNAIHFVRRYEAILRNQKTLPISRDRYTKVKDILKSNPYFNPHDEPIFRS